MCSWNPYRRAYKPQTERLIYWLIHTFSDIPEAQSRAEDISERYETTGKITVRTLLHMARQIAEHSDPVTSETFHLFRSVIQLRSAALELFQGLAAETNDAETIESNQSHEFFVQALQEAFEVLGGLEWSEAGTSDCVAIKPQGQGDQPSLPPQEPVSLERPSSDEEQEEPKNNNRPAQRKQANRSKRPKGKKGTQKKKKQQQQQQQKKAKSKKSVSDKLTLESYGLVGDDHHEHLEHRFASYRLFKEMRSCRQFIQKTWRDVADDKLNSAAASTLSILAVEAIKRMELAIFVEFSGRDDFEAVLGSITGAASENHKEQKLSEDRELPKDQETSKDQKTLKDPDLSMSPSMPATEEPDKKEQYLLHAFNDLVDFITDYRKAGTGKPTKPMREQLDRWVPELNLQKATQEQRVQWRRLYTINWLYDLINVHVKLLREMGNPKRPEEIALYDFSKEIHRLALEKAGTPFRHRIQPHLVFQLQCVVDSKAVFSGWSVDGNLGQHVFAEPVPATRAMRDIKRFMFGDNYKPGILRSLDDLSYLLDDKVQGTFVSSFRKLLTRTIAQTMLPPPGSKDWASRFPGDPLGLWLHCPFLCGDWLVWALEMAYKTGMFILEKTDVAIIYIHQFNMLRKSQPCLCDHPTQYKFVVDLFESDAFVGGEAPSSNFLKALDDRFLKGRDTKAFNRDESMPNYLDPGQLNKFFTQRSNLLLYRRAGWDVDQIPDEDLSVSSSLALARKSGKEHLERTGLVAREKPEGMSTTEMLELARRDLHCDISGSQVPRSGVNLFAFLSMLRKTSIKWEHALEKSKLSMYKEIYGRTDLGINVRRYELVAMVLAGEAEGCLREFKRVVPSDITHREYSYFSGVAESSRSYFELLGQEDNGLERLL